MFYYATNLVDILFRQAWPARKIDASPADIFRDGMTLEPVRVHRHGVDREKNRTGFDTCLRQRLPQGVTILQRRNKDRNHPIAVHHVWGFTMNLERNPLQLFCVELRQLPFALQGLVTSLKLGKTDCRANIPGIMAQLPQAMEPGQVRALELITMSRGIHPAGYVLSHSSSEQLYLCMGAYRNYILSLSCGSPATRISVAKRVTCFGVFGNTSLYSAHPQA
jgi:hypothetical protein